MKKKKKTSIEQREPAPEKQEYEMGYVKGQRWKAFLLLFGGVILLLVSVWLYSKTLGTNLLFTDAFLGRVSRYYWVVLIPAAIALLAGGLMTRKRKIPKPKMPAAEPARQAEAAEIQPKVQQEPQPKVQPETKPEVQPETQPEIPSEYQPEEQETEEKESSAAEPARQAESAEIQPEIQSEPQPKVQPETKPEESDADTCPGCGKKKKPGNAFCIYCGYKFS